MFLKKKSTLLPMPAIQDYETAWLIASFNHARCTREWPEAEFAFTMKVLFFSFFLFNKNILEKHKTTSKC